jgi:NADPH-dependent 2,4-dienoyl-CoA reductase/sulfur reductase-like enzyme/rhodanese-related sulfurtransferase
MAGAKKVVIVGGVAGGASAAARARRLSEDVHITLIERGNNISFANCGLPYYIGGTIIERENLLVSTPEKMSGWYNIDIRTQTEIIKIDRKKKEVVARNLLSSEETRIPYDALVLSPGAAPIRPSIPGVESSKIYTLRNLEDTDKIRKACFEGNAQRAVVIGGGYVGLEMAEAFRDLDMEVTIVELLPQVMNVADIELAHSLHRELKKHGVVLKLGISATGFIEKDNALEVKLSDGSSIACDIAILAIGVRPETSLAKDAGLKIGDRGGVMVDEHMRTSDPDIYAVGDAVQTGHLISDYQMFIPLAGPANRQGRIAADNIFGRDSKYQKTQGTAICKVFDLAIGMTGLSEKALVAEKIPYEKVYIYPFSHATYYPGACPMMLKVMFDPKSGKILGAQAVGKDGIDKRIDVLAMAIRAGMTVFDLEHVELSYAPPFGSAKDPVNYAGFVASNIIKGDVKPCHVEEIVLNPDKFFLLDVRNHEEIDQMGLIPNAVNIPLAKLRGKLDTLPKGKEIVAYCLVGLRGYIACRILSQKGFNARNLIGGYRAYRDCTGDPLPLDQMK